MGTGEALVGSSLGRGACVCLLPVTPGQESRRGDSSGWFLDFRCARDRALSDDRCVPGIPGPAPDQSCQTKLNNRTDVAHNRWEEAQDSRPYATDDQTGRGRGRRLLLPAITPDRWSAPGGAEAGGRRAGVATPPLGVSGLCSRPRPPWPPSPRTQPSRQFLRPCP